MSDDAPAPTGRPRPRPRPTAPMEPVVTADPVEPDEPSATAAEPEPEAPATPVRGRRRGEGRSKRKGAGKADGTTDDATDSEAEEGSGSRGRLVARAMQVIAVLLVVAGVAVFAVARARDDGTTPSASARTAAEQDPRARLDDPSGAQAFVSAASTEVVIVTESDYRRLDDALSAGESVTTGKFRARFRAALTGAAAAKRVAEQSVTSIQVLATGIGADSADGTTAQVLVFARVSQTGTEVPAGDGSVVTTLRLTMVRRGQQFLISDLVQGANAGLPSGTAGLKAAAEAARQKVVDTLTYSRASFATDLAKAKSGTDGTLRTSLDQGSAATLARMTAGGYDLTGAVTAIAAGQVTDNAVVLLVAATGWRVAAGGAKTVDVDGHYQVVAQRTPTAWVVTSITPVGAS